MEIMRNTLRFNRLKVATAIALSTKPHSQEKEQINTKMGLTKMTSATAISVRTLRKKSLLQMNMRGTMAMGL